MFVLAGLSLSAESRCGMYVHEGQGKLQVCYS